MQVLVVVFLVANGIQGDCTAAAWESRFRHGDEEHLFGMSVIGTFPASRAGTISDAVADQALKSMHLPHVARLLLSSRHGSLPSWWL